MSYTTEPDPGALRVVERCDDRPEIKITLEASDVADEAAQHLSSDGEIYQRGGMLVHVVTPTASSPGAAVAPTIRELPLPILRVRLAQVARWLKFATKDREWKRVDVPEKVVSAVYTRGQWEYVRPLVGVLSAPTMRRDGSILQSPGYDVPTGLLLWPTADFFAVPDEPTIEDAQGAAQAILDIVIDFPFATENDRSAWLAGFLTLLARHAIDGPCPLFAVDANTRGSGKSRLVDAASIAAYGLPAARSPISSQDEEMRKSITSLLSEGAPTVLFDNVRSGGRIGGPALDALLTSDVWRDRLLGKTQTLTLPARTVWWLTGNNVQMTGDLPRRTLKIRLQSPLEDPEDRSGFKHGEGGELLRHIDRHRRLLVTQGLIILRAHFLAGRPDMGAHWGSFESWCRIIASAIRWVGLPDPLVSRATEDESSDEDRLFIGATIAVLEAVGRPITARELVAELYPPTRYDNEPFNDPSEAYAPAREALEAATAAKGNPNAQHVGIFLKRIHGRIVGGKSVVSVLDAHLKVQRWKVEP